VKKDSKDSKKKFKFFPMVPPMEFLFTLWYLKGSKKNLEKCRSGQGVIGYTVSGQSFSPAKASFWPNFHKVS
jgi:hypothetical protein